MFDSSMNGKCSDENSELVNMNKTESVTSISSNLISSPSLLTRMSHEMRTHMNAIVAFSFLLKENGFSNSENEEYSNQILRSCEQIIGLFDSFLDSALIDTGISNSDFKICNLDNFLDDLLADFRIALEKEEHSNLELITEILDSNSTEVSIDANRVIRVIKSLFHNSLRNTKSGYIKIGYSFRDENLDFYILDSGQGYFKGKEFLYSDNMNDSLAQYNDPYSAINITLARKLVLILGGTIRLERNDIAGIGIYFSVPAKRIVSSLVNESKYVNSIMTT